LAAYEQTVTRDQTNRATTKVKLVRDAIGGIQLTTENNELLQNVFVKQCERIEGSVTRLNLEVIFVSQDDKIKNW
jgi:hypothetical protein